MVPDLRVLLAINVKASHTTPVPYHNYLHLSTSMVLKVWFLDQQHRHHLGT